MKSRSLSLLLGVRRVYNWRRIGSGISAATRGFSQFLVRDKGRRIAKEKMNGSHFSRRFDGRFHAMVKALPSSQCQYCYFVWNHEYDKK